MPDAMRDPATGLDCTETPLFPPRVAGLGDISVCNSCNLVISASVAGPKSYIFREGKDGLGIDESPLATLTYNGHSYGLLETVLWKQGAHRDFKAEVPYDMEMNVYFRDIYEPRNLVAIAIPITIDDSRGKHYFTELTNQNPASRGENLEQLIGPGPVLTYKGIDLRGRNFKRPTGSAQCNSVDSNLTWFVIPTTYISNSNAAKIRSIENPLTSDAERTAARTARARMTEAEIKRDVLSNALPPMPDHELPMERIRAMTMIVQKMETQTSVNSQKSSADKASATNGIYLTRALQCQRIDPVRDVKKNVVYLPDSRKTTLKEELETAASLDQPLLEGRDTGIRASEVESLIALILGIVVGILLFGVIAYYIMLYVYKDYLQTITINKAITNAAADAVPKNPS
jgi:hypothetical protein